ncbi:MAG: EAL domain-containing protein [Actinobacteria bacterium]|nr:EAL domain-containing protein [Actinomycetota bacterium]
MSRPATPARPKPGEFSLRTVSLSSLTWYLTVSCGLGLIVLAGYHVMTSAGLDLTAALIMDAVLLVALELLPLVQGRGHDPQGVVMSTAFTCAVLFLWGIWPAVLMIAVASIAADLNVGKSWWKVAFNPAQYALSVAAGYLVMRMAGHPSSLAHPLRHFGVSDLGWAFGVWMAYFIVNLALVAAAVSYTSSFMRVITDDYWHYTSMTFAVLALSPLIVIVSLHAWALTPLLLIPLLLLYHTAQMSLEREHAAAHDALTGLANRDMLQFTLGEALEAFHHDGRSFGLLLIDLDDFKLVNDTLGHQVGDMVLVHFAERLRGCIRPGDQVCRLGGDEFAVVVAAADEQDVRAVAERVSASFGDPFELEGVLLEIEPSIGIAVCPLHGVDGDTLLRHADVAMYQAKEAHTGIESYRRERDGNSADRLSLIGELRQALEDDAIELHYQPKLTTVDASVLGVEALVRWNHPQRGYIPPDSFIPLAERSGIMHLLTERVVNLALEQISTWRAEGMHVPIAVNISPADLLGRRLSGIVTAGLRRHEIPASMLQLEITERMVDHHLSETSQALSELRELGVTVSLDDFGTGYSSLMRLHELPVDEIKIDRAFISSMGSGSAAEGIVQALVDLAHALGLPAIAEGVETPEEWQRLRAFRCDGVQGWHVAVPMPGPDATIWLRRRHPDGRTAPSSHSMRSTKAGLVGNGPGAGRSALSAVGRPD